MKCLMSMKAFVIFVLLLKNVFASNIFISHYVFEWGVKNPKIVEEYLRSSSETNAFCSYILGNLYLFGIFVQQNIQKADWYITKAANMNLPEAINSIGDGYYSGDIRKKDIKMALKFYKKAANMGFGVAQFNAGVVLLNTAKTKIELKNAIWYLDRASKNQKDLGDITNAAKRYKNLCKQKLKTY